MDTPLLLTRFEGRAPRPNSPNKSPQPLPLKVTNNRATSLATIAKLGQVCLHSMHKYVPRVHVQRLDAAETAGLDLAAKAVSAEQAAAAGIEQDKQGGGPNIFTYYKGASRYDVRIGGWRGSWKSRCS